ncbi:aldehyde dehydrogenase family protein [Sulfuriroseicoccus oceanibius]|uniref:Aldehyde dehydrogenase n=1 Tax=Sulfuriroseicoccus oceanibius TaxID=2707525 RepID=A0A6B3L180_9BACT|nr:aldehyde dehydrogenase family protein [Sulfuriroseicoccus oceanibius]QQL46048.1 aldehyde dehydrogenase family protein [Sulfuriroseicoccus oceanibius]
MDSHTSQDQIIRSITQHKAYFESGNTLPLQQRINALNLLEKNLIANRDALIDALHQDLGKPELEAHVAEYHFLLEEIRLVTRKLAKWVKPGRARTPLHFHPSRASIQRDPFGVTLIIAPWNYPIQLSIAPLISAIAAGNTVILKPSELAPPSEQLLTKLIADTFDPAHATVITGDASTSRELLAQPFDFIFFTGSTEVGRIVAQQAAAHLTPCILELGGKCPVVVDEHTDIEQTARRILIGKFFNGGQTCFAPDFVAVHENAHAELVAAMTELLRTTPWHQEMAHIINRRHYDRIQSLITGTEVCFESDDADALRIAPRLLPDAQWSDPALNEEIFGPVLPIVKFSNRNELITRLRKFTSPLALYLFSSDKSFTRELTHAIRSGSVCINDTMKQSGNLNLPFGGVGASGHGRYRGRFGVESFTYQRPVVRRPFLKDLFEIIPPYAEKLPMIRRFLK